MAHLQAAVPQGVEEGLRRLLDPFGLERGLVQQQQIDVGKGEEFPAAVTAQGDQGDPFPELAQSGEILGEAGIDDFGMPEQQRSAAQASLP